MEFDYAHKTVTLQSSEMRENPNRNFFWFDYPFVRLLSPKAFLSISAWTQERMQPDTKPIC